ncbi:AAA family ATPase [Afipia sp. Root123D2]|uniref:AAA family ATPase n=1 Tax=Afipia sp. Root123D2 TaxID=1736436 RepID=UPI0009E6982B|nr:AAA family ATPase [Afipia sp. Root123D2]
MTALAANSHNTADESVVHLRRGLIGHGYRIIPVEGKKACGLNWPNAKWTADQMDGLARLHSDATNTGILTGHVVAIDVDTPDPETANAVAAMVEQLPWASAAPYRIGKAPKRCYLFRTASPRAKASTGAYEIGGHKCQLEVLGAGNQFVAFGVHPDTGSEYQWFNGSPAETPLSDLPDISPADIEELLARVEEHFASRGTLLKRASKTPANDNDRTSLVWSDHPWSMLNQRAYDHLDDWVPQLGLEGLKRYHSGYHSVASFRPSNSASAKKRGRALNIQPEGICDYADSNKGYTPIDLVGACLGMQPHEAVDWLTERVGELDNGTPRIDTSKLTSKLAGDGTTPEMSKLRERFNVTWFGDIEQGKPKAWTIKGVLGDGEMTTISGLPGTGKSVITGDGCFHVAAGMDWFGRRVTQGMVAYVAAERRALTERRMVALRKHYGVYDVPLVVISGRLDMTSSLVDAKALANVIKQASDDCGQRCVWIVLDTLTRVFGPGDQNASKDMSKFIAACDELVRLTGSHLTVVHHTAWSGERGKGAIDLDGAVDASFLVSKNAGTYTLKCDGANDGEEGTIATFTMQSVEIAKDEEGEPTTAPVVVAGESVATKMAVSGYAKKVLEALRAAVANEGVAPEGPSFPDGVSVVTEDQWRSAYYEADANAANGTLQKRFVRAKAMLSANQQAQQVGEWFWPT